MKWSELQEWAEVDALPLAVELAEDPPKPWSIQRTCELRLVEWFGTDEWHAKSLKEQSILTSVLAWKLAERICQGYAFLGSGWNGVYMDELRRLYEEENP